MAYYYYPLSTHDFTFENIFSSESISPASYYSSRAFGFDYFPVLPGIGSKDAIVLYSHPPIYQDGSNTKFILRISENLLNPDDLFFLAEGIFAYQGTIYFNKQDLDVLFFSDKDIRVAVLKSNLSLPTKATEKYSSTFRIINDTDCRAFSIIDENNIKSDVDRTSKISLDKKYNHFKGFIYGLVIGQIANDRKRELGLKAHLQGITNAFAELKSRIDDQVSRRYRDDTAKRLHPYIEKLFRTIDTTEVEYHQLNFGGNIDEKTLIQYVLNKASRLKSYEDAVRYIDHVITTDEILGRSDYKKIIDSYIREQGALSTVFQDLRNYFRQFIDIFQSEKSPRQTAEDLNNRVKVLLRNITEEYLSNLSSRNYDLKIDLSGISYEFASNEVMLNIGQVYLDTKADNEFTFIINAILKFVKANKGPAQMEMILKIVEEIGNIYSKRGKNTLLYQYLENKIDVYSLDNASNLVMKNFVAFVFNPDSLEKLDNFLASKQIEERWMAYSFWGAYNGFANISRNYTHDIFSVNNLTLQDQIDSYLMSYILTVVNTKPNVITSQEEEFKTVTQEINAPKRDTNQEWIVNFYKLHVSNQYNLSIDEFIAVTKFAQLKDFQDELKSKYKIAKKDSQKLYNTIKKYFDPNALFH